MEKTSSVKMTRILISLFLFCTVSLIAEEPREYIIKGGDTIPKIAQEQLGDMNRYTEIEALNPDLDSFSIKVGQKILLPAKEKSDSTVLGKTGHKNCHALSKLKEEIHAGPMRNMPTEITDQAPQLLDPAAWFYLQIEAAALEGDNQNIQLIRDLLSQDLSKDEQGQTQKDYQEKIKRLLTLIEQANSDLNCHK
tara:strand:+ start:85 stop:666 length:582 start_codon:yes stop_codon:yes gene_type:complete